MSSSPTMSKTTECMHSRSGGRTHHHTCIEVSVRLHKEMGGTLRAHDRWPYPRGPHVASGFRLQEFAKAINKKMWAPSTLWLPRWLSVTTAMLCCGIRSSVGVCALWINHEHVCIPKSSAVCRCTHSRTCGVRRTPWKIIATSEAAISSHTSLANTSPR